MSYPTEAQRGTARYRAAADVEQINYKSGSSTRFVAPGSVTNGQYGLFE